MQLLDHLEKRQLERALRNHGASQSIAKRAISSAWRHRWLARLSLSAFLKLAEHLNDAK